MVSTLRNLIVVNGYAPVDQAAAAEFNLRDEMLSMALDQRAFGPGKLLVAFGDSDGTFRGLAYTDRRDPIDSAFDACLDYLGSGAATAVAFNDEPVVVGEPAPWLAERFIRMQTIAALHGVTLIDWVSCDDEYLRPTRLGQCPQEDWWSVGRA